MSLETDIQKRVGNIVSVRIWVILMYSAQKISNIYIDFLCIEKFNECLFSR